MFPRDGVQAMAVMLELGVMAVLGLEEVDLVAVRPLLQGLWKVMFREAHVAVAMAVAAAAAVACMRLQQSHRCDYRCWGQDGRLI